MKIDSSNYTLSVLSSMTATENTERKPLGTIRSSGQYSPQAGYWQLSESAVSAVISLRRGDIMPYYQGKPAAWALIEYDLTQEIEI
ncbi:hypothetical protein AB4K05_13475 [Kluyvera sp. STS39-E]|uniref:hypothetical protein n=1 Tax=Kluyvera sp. STS39-E TaxID=3234748 RepID=UPI0034C5E9F1